MDIWNCRNSAYTAVFEYSFKNKTGKEKSAKLLNRYNPDGTECAPRGTFATNISIYVILALLDFAAWFIVANI